MGQVSSMSLRMLASYADELREKAEMSADHLGPLRMLLEPLDPKEAAGWAPPSETLPDVQPLLSDQIRPEMLGAIFAEAPEAEAFVAAAAQAAQTAEEAAGLATEAAAEAADIVDSIREKEEHFDVQTAQVGLVIRRFMEASDGPVLLEDLIPARCTEKVTAARTFACLLSLASGGGLQVLQCYFGVMVLSSPRYMEMAWNGKTCMVMTM